MKYCVRVVPFVLLLLILALGPSVMTGDSAGASADPLNDNFQDAIVISEPLPYANAQSTIGATSQPGESAASACGGTDKASVWYTFTPRDFGPPFSSEGASKNLLATTLGSDYDTELSVYRGISLDTLEPIRCSTDTFDLTSSVTFEPWAGDTYYFLVDGHGGATGELVFSLSLAPPPLELGFVQFGEGTVDPKSGAATISGIVLCSGPASLTLRIELEQERGRKSVYGVTLTSIPECDGQFPFSVRVEAGRPGFKAGLVRLTESFFGWDLRTGLFVAAGASGLVQLNLEKQGS